jgi:hypothetical protein
VVGFSTRQKAGSEPIQRYRTDTTPSDERSTHALQGPISAYGTAEFITPTNLTALATGAFIHRT